MLLFLMSKQNTVIIFLIQKSRSRRKKFQRKFCINFKDYYKRNQKGKSSSAFLKIQRSKKIVFFESIKMEVPHLSQEFEI